VSKAPEHLSQQELESYLWGAAKLLRGLIDAGDYKQYVFPLLFFKRLTDVWDEEYRAALDETDDEAYARATADDRFAIPDGAHWSDVRGASRDVGRALLNAFRAIEAANPERLSGVFGNAAWTDKAQLPDETLKNLIEHFSSHRLSLAAVPEDELGNGYEYLIKQFADDSGHTAQEFYTNRTLVHLMVQMLEPQAGDRIYDPTVGTGGMLISALAEVKRRSGDTRTLRLYGEERINITAAIARMNLVLHGVEDFEIVAGNTLSNPAFVERDRLKTFDVVLANPPYSIKKWNREAWRSLGTKLPRHAAARTRRLRLLSAHPEEPGSEDRPLRDPLPSRSPLSQRRGRDAAQARRVGSARVRARTRAEPFLQLADGSVRRYLPDAEARRPPGEDPFHRRCARSDTGASAKLPEA
jgi:type I restriction enzyme M protein